MYRLHFNQLSKESDERMKRKYTIIKIYKIRRYNNFKLIITYLLVVQLVLVYSSSHWSFLQNQSYIVIRWMSNIKYVFKLTEIHVCVKADKEMKVKKKVFDSW